MKNTDTSSIDEQIGGLITNSDRVLRAYLLRLSGRTEADLEEPHNAGDALAKNALVRDHARIEQAFRVAITRSPEHADRIARTANPRRRTPRSRPS